MFHFDSDTNEVLRCCLQLKQEESEFVHFWWYVWKIKADVICVYVFEKGSFVRT